MSSTSAMLSATPNPGQNPTRSMHSFRATNCRRTWRALLLSLGGVFESPPIVLRRISLLGKHALQSAWRNACPATSIEGDMQLTFDDVAWPGVEAVMGALLKQGERHREGQQGDRKAAAASHRKRKHHHLQQQREEQQELEQQVGEDEELLGGGRRLPQAALTQLSALASMVGALWKQLTSTGALSTRQVHANSSGTFHTASSHGSAVFGAAAAGAGAEGVAVGAAGAGDVGELPSTLLLLLQRAPWLPSPWAGGVSLPGRQLFVSGSEALRLFGAGGVPFLVRGLQQQLPGAMVRAVGMRTELTVETLVEVGGCVGEWVGRCGGELDGRVHGYLTLVHNMIARYSLTGPTVLELPGKRWKLLSLHRSDDRLVLPPIRPPIPRPQ